MLHIKVLGAGCKNCELLHRTTEEVLREEGIEANLEYITDMAVVSSYVLSTPGLVINEQVAHQGKPLPDKKKVALLIHSVLGKEEG